MEIKSTDHHLGKSFDRITSQCHIKELVKKYYGNSANTVVNKITRKNGNNEGSQTNSKDIFEDFHINSLTGADLVFSGLKLIQDSIFSKITESRLSRINNINNKLVRRNNFWLPEVQLTPQISRDIEEKFVNEENKELPELLEKSQHPLKPFLKLKGFIDDSNSSFHVCQMLDGSWAVITNVVLISLSDKNGTWLSEDIEIVFTLPLKHIIALAVDANLSLIYFITGPECVSRWDLIPGEIVKTEYFISYLIVATLRVRNTSDRNDNNMFMYKAEKHFTLMRKTRFIDVIRMPILSIPSCNSMNDFVCQDNEFVLYTGSVIATNIYTQTDFEEEFMMQIEGEKFKPIMLALRGTTITVSFSTSADKPNQLSMLCDITKISSIQRVEDPRPHTIFFTWKSTNICFSASNSSTANQLFDLICSYRHHKTQIQKSRPAHVVVTDKSLLLFSTAVDKALLFQTPLINILKAKVAQGQGKENWTELLIETEIVEAEEVIYTGCENLKWSLSLENYIEAQKLCNLLRRLA